MAAVGRIQTDFPAPVARFDTTAVQLYVKQEEDWYRAPFSLQKANYENATDRNIEMIAEWIPGAEYSFEVDSAAFESIYGLVSDAFKSGLKINTPDQYSTLFVNVSGVPEGLLPPDSLVGDSLAIPCVVVQMLDGSDKVIETSKAENGMAEFYYVKEGEYYLRAFVDRNGNGKWDTGNYEEHLQPEEVYYFPEKVDCRAKWDVTRNWNLTSRPLNLQKPGKLIKQKSDSKKKIKLRNAQRANEKGIALPERFKAM